MIDEKVLINHFRKVDEDYHNGFNKHAKFAYVTADYVVRTIKKQPKVGEWIPCSKRLPEDKQEVLITDDQGKVRQIIFNEWLYKNPRFSSTLKFFAWQPLPEPYREGGEKDESSN